MKNKYAEKFLNDDSYYLQNKKGGFDPIDSIKPVDNLKHEVVMDLVYEAKEISDIIKKFKENAFEQILTTVQIAGMQHGVKIGGVKGNITLVSYCGKFKASISAQERITLDDTLTLARELVSECINEWARDSSVEIKTLVNRAFKTNMDGNVSVKAVLELLQINIDHPKWKKAMDLIKESIKVLGSSKYVRIYERVGESEKWKLISLNIADV